MSEKISPPENTSENLESKIGKLVIELAEREEMNPEDIESDIITFAPHPENESSNPEYFEELAERMGIPLGEITHYALKKFEESRE